MKGSLSLLRILLVLPLVLLLVCSLVPVVEAQGVAQFPAHRNPANDCGCPQGSDAIPVSSGLLAPFLPKIPNLELGFQYYFGNRVNTGRFTADYVLPFRLGWDSVLFGEAHAEGWDFWKRSTVSVAAAPGFTVTTSDTSNRVDLSFGGGYRTMMRENTFLGVNGFYDTSRLFNKWYSSGGVGLEMAANIAGDDAIDLNFNWYGNLFNRDVLINAFRNKGNSFDVEAGYSHSLLNQALDLRLKFAGYQFDVGNPVYGWRSGADLTTKNGMFTVRYEHGQDRINGDYNTLGGFLNVGFQLENLLSGESPFTLPEPVFRSPRDLRRLLGLKVKRNWHQPAGVVLARTSASPSPGPITATADGSCVSFGTQSYPLTPAVPFAATSSLTTLTITFSEAHFAAFIRLASDTGDVTSLVGSSQLVVVISKVAHPDWFGAVLGTSFDTLQLYNTDEFASWCASPVTLVWQ
ncbi:MAG: hypothetical protein ACLP5H_22995 [Desulfomonilaceae bacterium]